VGIDEFLNQIVYGLYARAQNGTDPGFGPALIVIDHPLDADAVLKSPQYFQKNFSLLSYFGRSRFNTNGDEWRHRRNLTQPSYVRAARPDNRKAIYSAYQAALSSIQACTGSDIQRALLSASSVIFYRSFGFDLRPNHMLSLFELARSIVKKLQYFSWNRPGANEVSALADEVKQTIAVFDAEIRQVPELQKLLEMLKSQSVQIADFSALEEFLMNFFAGIETTAATLSWAIDRLGADQRAQEKIYQELCTEDKAQPLLESFINETMRYFPAIPFVIREVTADVVIGERQLARGSLLLLSVIGVHHHREFWKEPHIFDSFRSEFIDNTHDPRALIPFLTGPRTCGGAKLARLEIFEGLKAFVRSFRVERSSDQVKFDYGLALRPATWRQLTIVRR
jgi:cytochrome P450